MRPFQPAFSRSTATGRCSSDPVASSALLIQCRCLTAETVTCPLAQSVERIHGKENSGAILLVR